MSDKSSHVFSGLGSALQATYSAANTSEQTVGQDCSAYRNILAYVSVSEVVSSGKALLKCEFSPDGASWFDPQDIASGSQVLTSVTLTATGDFMFTFDNAGAFVRLTVTYVTGESVNIDSFIVEGVS